MRIGVYGTGSWATALAQVLADNGRDVIMYGRNPEEVKDINDNHRNSRYLDADLNPDISASDKIEILNSCDIVLLGIPVKAFKSALEELDRVLDHQVLVINVAKGFYEENEERLSVVIKEKLKDKVSDVVSLIGPSHAEEVVLRLTTLVNAVCENEEAAKLVQELFSNDYFRVYRSDDVIGAEIAAAIKNVIAIASGMIEGLDQGDNARAALVTRGLAEMSRFGTFFGGRKETFLGLNGVGDLMVTCSSMHSRNFTAGLEIGRDDSAERFLRENTRTTEGINTSKSVYELSLKHGIEMPITREVYRVLFENKKPSVALIELMRRELKIEGI